MAAAGALTLTLILASLATQLATAEDATGAVPWRIHRGANVGVELTEQDVADFAALGGDLLRLSFPVKPLMALDPPHAYDEEAFAFLEQVLDWSEAHGVHVLIDPHRYPGTEHEWTMLGSDPFWQDFRFHDLVIGLWEEIAKRCARRGAVVAGYDLLNEPQVPSPIPVGTPFDINLLYGKLVKAIRKHDTRHTIVLAAPRFTDEDGKLHRYNEGIALLETPEDDNLCFETHMYEPQTFSHQGIQGRSGELVHYPGTIDGERWDAERVRSSFEPVVAFAERTGQPILLGEFSCPRWLGEEGNTYLRDLIEVAESNGWSWAYHAYREYHAWDAELSNEDEEARERLSTTPRLELLRGYFGRAGVDPAPSPR